MDANDAEVSLSYDELEVLRQQYQKELAQKHVTVQTNFNYAWGLVKSPMREHQVQGVGLLQALLMDKEPTNMQALSLAQLIEKGVAREGYIGMAIVGGAAAVGALLFAGLIRRATRK
ncbi:hypothetical protein C8J56DRAFT_1015113 [Mycena floridula]|nr:hypothetical protein C8J56DRAFT_1015113 [Mycena floridula]